METEELYEDELVEVDETINPLEGNVESENVAQECENIYNHMLGLSLLTHNISSEAMPLFLKNISQLFVNKLTAVKNVLGFNSDKTNKKLEVTKGEVNEFLKQLVKLKNDARDISSYKEFSNVSEFQIPTVVGMKVDLVTMSVNLQEAFQMISNNVMTYINSIDDYVAQVLADPDFRMSNRPQPINTDIVKLEDNLYKLMSKVVDSKKMKDVAKVKDVLPNLSSLHGVIETLFKTGDGITLKNMKELDGMITEITNKITILQEEMGKPEFEVNKNIIKKLATDLENGAKLVTVATSYVHLFNQTVIVTKSIIERLK